MMMPLLVWHNPSRFGAFFLAMTMDTQTRVMKIIFHDKDEQNLWLLKI